MLIKIGTILKNNRFQIWNFKRNHLHLDILKQTEIMKNFTAIYDTKTYKNIEYAFQAKDMESAKEFASWKFDFSIVSNFIIIED